LLDSLQFDDEVLDWVKQALMESFGDKKKLHDESLSRIRTETDRLDKRLKGLYLDKLDGRSRLLFMTGSLPNGRNSDRSSWSKLCPFSKPETIIILMV
jgi:hypothetical protein